MFSSHRPASGSGARNAGTGTSFLTLLLPLMMNGRIGRRIGGLPLWQKALLMGGLSLVAKKAQSMKRAHAVTEAEVASSPAPRHA